MSNISAVEAKLPPGFRFHPNDDELVCDYLMRKAIITEQAADNSLLMIDVDLNKCEPWDIPETACVGGKEWYFYSQRDRKYATGLRTNRATASGYWKATGKDRPILRKGTLVGMRKTLVFYRGRAPKGRKTDWVMHEFRMEGPFGPPTISSDLKEDWVLCRVFFKNREVASKSSCFGLNRGISSLPPLMDSYITFNPAQQLGIGMNSDHDYEQVPCFSNIFSQEPQPSNIFPHLRFLNTVPFKRNDSDVSVSVTAAATASYGSSSAAAVADLGSCFGSINYDPSDKKMLKAVLSQLNKVEYNNNNNNNNSSNLKESSLSVGEGSSDSFLSEVGMPSISAWGRY